jgi:hypothetical protein
MVHFDAIAREMWFGDCWGRAEQSRAEQSRAEQSTAQHSTAQRGGGEPMKTGKKLGTAM